ncbi:MAG: nitrile hydratase subunit beta [Arenicellales bacterium]|nr:nitrile hydratase subunit beta [Arenicellales bacterium]
MNGGHDLGGMHGLGAVNPESETDEPVFHHSWERRVFALTLATGFLGRWNLDQSRHARERQHPIDYLRNTYYENWLAGLQTLLVDSGLLTKAELQSGSCDKSFPDHESVLTKKEIHKKLQEGKSVELPLSEPPEFVVGQVVMVVNRHPIGHTRAPRYTRGRRGTVIHRHGGHIFPDDHAMGDQTGQHLYTVCFSAVELWGEDNAGNDLVYVDLWESYLTSGEPKQ